MYKIFILLSLLLTNISLFSMYESEKNNDQVKRNSLIALYNTAQNEQEIPNTGKEINDVVQNYASAEIVIDINDNQTQSARNQHSSLSRMKRILRRICCGGNSDAEFYCAVCSASVVCAYTYCTIVISLVSIGLTTWSIILSSQ